MIDFGRSLRMNRQRAKRGGAITLNTPSTSAIRNRSTRRTKLQNPNKGRQHEIQNNDVHYRDDSIRCAGNRSSDSAGGAGSPGRAETGDRANSLQAYRRRYVGRPLSSWAGQWRWKPAP